MARITVSMADSLRTKLEAYSDEQKLSVSKVVSLALQAYLPGEDNPPDPELVNTQRYLAELVGQLDGLRDAVHRMTLAQYGPFSELPTAVTQSLPQPPTPRTVEDDHDEEE